MIKKFYVLLLFVCLLVSSSVLTLKSQADATSVEHREFLNEFVTRQEKVQALLLFLNQALLRKAHGTQNDEVILKILSALTLETEEHEKLRHKLLSARASTPGANTISGTLNVNLDSLQQIVATLTQQFTSPRNMQVDLLTSLPTWVKVLSGLVSTMTILSFVLRCYEWFGPQKKITVDNIIPILTNSTLPADERLVTVKDLEKMGRARRSGPPFNSRFPKPVFTPATMSSASSASETEQPAFLSADENPKKRTNTTSATDNKQKL